MRVYEGPALRLHEQRLQVSLVRLRLLILAALERVFFEIADLAAKKVEPPRKKPFCRHCGAQLLYLYSLIPGAPSRAPT